MGGLLLHLLDFNQDAMARKILASKRRVDGEIPVLEAPRNSLEMEVDSNHNCFDSGDDGLFFQQDEEDWPDSRCLPMEAPMKRLINEEMSRNRKTSPSIVARLMGVEMLPLDNVSVVHQPIHRRCESMENMILRNGKIEIGSEADCFSSSSNCSRKEQLDHWSNGHSSGKPTRREHPQEEELQKFKKEFEAWQAARFKECSRVAELVNVAGQLLAPKQFNRQDSRVAEADSEARQMKKSTESTSSHIQKPTSHERSPLQHQNSNMELSRTTSGNIENHCADLGERLQDKSSAQTRIVILKPGPDEFYGNEDCSCNSPPAIFEERGGMENFLQEVKERLTCELEGKAFKKRGSAVRGSGIETPFRELPSDHPKQIARDLAKHVRESVGTHLIRSESTRSSRSEMQQFSGYGSPEFMNRDTRRFLSERLKNVIRRKQTNWEIRQEEEPEMQTGSFRHGEDDGVGLCKELSSPKNLIRSLSAPVSGTSFGKLLLEDRHVLTGAHIRRKHEALDSVTEELKKQKKERFNIRQKVSSFRHNFTLRRMLFVKKFQRVESFNYGKDVHAVNARQPTSMNFGERQITMMENSTEVPPSPASICSSGQDDFWSRPADCLSQISTPDVTQEEDDYVMPEAFKDICSNLKELRKQINRLGLSDDDESELAASVDSIVEPLEEIDDKEESFIRDLLIASGLYDGSSTDICLSNPIPSSVFEQVQEEAAASSKKSAGKDNDEIEGSGKMLFDLLNEALTSVLNPGQRLMWVPCVRRNATGVRLPPLRGRKLHEKVWKMIREYVYPTPLGNHNHGGKSGAADDVVESHLGSMNSWSCGLIDEEELDEVGKEMQLLIMSDLIQEALEEMCLP
ncbi:unnamed protein product [Linum tenue]|uniref:DUF4378 domain-containing protein n=1 Tax=Linum tenue TaxID=586396 RepID=A0AAV0KJC6_9ROSI|nr:unnamed protein product [Linum tenue]CAI0421818.1 unnamed protein product [Linum tenue]